MTLKAKLLAAAVVCIAIAVGGGVFEAWASGGIDAGNHDMAVYGTVVMAVAGVVAFVLIIAATLVGGSKASSAKGGLPDELNRLASMHASGALSDDEFAAAKRRLLG